MSVCLSVSLFVCQFICLSAALAVMTPVITTPLPYSVSFKLCMHVEDKVPFCDSCLWNICILWWSNRHKMLSLCLFLCLSVCEYACKFRCVSPVFFLTNWLFFVYFPNCLFSAVFADSGGRMHLCWQDAWHRWHAVGNIQEDSRGLRDNLLKVRHGKVPKRYLSAVPCCVHLRCNLPIIHGTRNSQLLKKDECVTFIISTQSTAQVPCMLPASTWCMSE